MNDIGTILGGEEIRVTTVDGKTETVKVRQLPLSAYPAYLACQDDECVQVALLCDREPGWADTLTIESVEAILAKGDEINADFFGRWLRRRAARLDRIQGIVSPK